LIKEKKKYIFFIFILFFYSFFTVQPSYAEKGFIVAIGGGTEDSRSLDTWSSIVYRRIVELGNFGKVIVLSFHAETNWIPDYFKSLGASDAVNIKIDSKDKANSDQLYEALINCQIIFIKGGDQHNYTNFWKGTRVEKAIREVYLKGGIIAGTSAGAAVLGDWIFDAKEGSLYPDEAIRDPFHSKLTYTTDFLMILPDILFDSHFTERGRIGRLGPLLARVMEDNPSHDVMGVGIDDRTAVVINKELEAEILGQGSVTFIYKTPATDIVLTPGRPPIITHLSYHQLTQYFKFDLLARQVIYIPPSAKECSLQPRSYHFSHQVLDGSKESTSDKGDKKVINHLQDIYALYRGMLEVVPADNLVPKTIIMPNAFADHDYFENRIGGCQYALALNPNFISLIIDKESVMEVHPPGLLKSRSKKRAIRMRSIESGIPMKEPAILILDSYGVSWVDFSDWITGENNPGPRQSVAMTGISLHFLAKGWKYDLINRKASPDYR
jgi:cyanophycinase